MTIIKLTLAILGAVLVVPVALKLGTDMKKLPIWGNKEEGPPKWFLDKDRPLPNWWWYSVRNPVNNMRYLFEDPVDYEVEGWAPNSMEAYDLINNELDSASYWRYKGPFAGYRKVWLTDEGKYSEFWVGFKVGSTVPGLGFTLQWRRNRVIGT